MNCKEIQELVEEVVENRLSASCRRKVNSHLSHCAKCRSFLAAEKKEHAAFFRALNDVSDIPPPATPADVLAARLASAATAASKRAGSVAVPLWLKRVALISLLLGGAAFAAWVGTEWMASSDAVASGESTDNKTALVPEGESEMQMKTGLAALSAAATLATNVAVISTQTAIAAEVAGGALGAEVAEGVMSGGTASTGTKSSTGQRLAVAPRGLLQATSDLEWTGNGDGIHWNDAANWDGTHKPGSGYRLVFQNSTACNLTNDMGDVTVGGLYMNGTANLTIGGTGKITVVSQGDFQHTATANTYFDAPVHFVKTTATYLLRVGGNADYGVYFRGGLTSDNTIYPSGSGQLHIQNIAIPLSQQGTRISFYAQSGAPHIWFDVGGNNVNVTGYWSAHFHFNAVDAIKGFLSVGHKSTSGDTYDLCGHDQGTFTKFTSVAKTLATAPEITSVDKAKLILQGSGQGNPVVSARFTGKAGLEWTPDDAGTLTFTNITQTTQGELAATHGTIRLIRNATFTNLAKLTVGSMGVFQVDAGGGSNFHAAELEIAEGGVLRLAAGVTLSVDRVKVIASDSSFVYLDFGETYTADAFAAVAGFDGIEGEGVVVVAAGAVEPTTATWDAGGGADTSISLPANWEGDVLPDLSLGGLTAVFGTGSEVMIDRTVKLAGISVTSAGNLTFKKTQGKSIKLMSGGLSVAAGASARSVTFEAPVMVNASQTWVVSNAADSVVVTGRLMGASANTLSFTGGGKLYLSGTNDYAGELVFMPTTASTLYLNNADMAGPIHIGNKTATSAIGNTVAISGDTVLRGYVNMRDSVKWVNGGGVLTFAGGGLRQLNEYFRGSGHIVVTNAALGHLNLKTLWCDAPVTVELYAMHAMNTILYNGARVYGRVTQALRGDGSLQMGLSAFDQDRRGWLYMDADQHCKDFITYPARDGSGAQEVYSASNAVLQITPTANHSCYATFGGGASLRHNGAFTTTLLKASSSTGTVTVLKGTLVFGMARTETFLSSTDNKNYEFVFEGGSWEQMRSMTVGGGTESAVVKLEHSLALGKETEVCLEQNGKLCLDAKVAARAGTLWIRGQKMPSGIYGSSTSVAPLKNDTYFEGTGILCVGLHGMMIIIK